MMPSLLAVAGPTAGTRYDLGGEAVIGRSPSCEIPVLDGRVSRKHARLFSAQGNVLVEDLSSRNGTLVNGAKVGRPRALEHGDKVQIGDAVFVFEGAPEAAAVAGLGTSAALPIPAGADAASLKILLAAAAEIAASDSAAAALRHGARAAARILDGEASAYALVRGAMHPASGSSLAPRAMLEAAARGEASSASLALGHPGADRPSSGGAAFAVAPVTGPAGVVGALAVERAEGFGPEERDLLAALGALAGAAVAAHPAEAEPVLVGTSRTLARVVEQAEKIAVGGAPALVMGEPGSGRATLARLLHARSGRRLGAVVEVACVRATAEELFGSEAPRRAGALERADGGTLLLRDVHLLARPLQDRLDRALATRSFTREGGGLPAEADTRAVATSSYDLQQLADHGRFDRELARRLSGARLDLPPLRSRKADVPALADHLVARHRAELGRQPLALAEDARAALCDYGWPGNLRELDAACGRLAALVPDGGAASLEDLTQEIRVGAAHAGGEPSLGDQVARLERAAVQAALTKARGKKIKAAALLGISRPTLDKKIALYDLVVK